MVPDGHPLILSSATESLARTALGSKPELHVLGLHPILLSYEKL
jgi:hypothetical protein